MAKIKIYEYAKQIDKPSKELEEYLNEKGCDIKRHIRYIEDIKKRRLQVRLPLAVTVLPRWICIGTQFARIGHIGRRTQVCCCIFSINK